MKNIEQAPLVQTMGDAHFLVQVILEKERIIKGCKKNWCIVKIKGTDKMMGKVGIINIAQSPLAFVRGGYYVQGNSFYSTMGLWIGNP